MLVDSLSYYYSEQERDWGPPGEPLEPGELLAPGYRVVEHLRRGSRLDVYDLWSEERACRCVGKTLRPERAADETAAGWLRNEGLLLTTLTHPHLVRGYETVLTSEPARPAVVTETLPGFTLGFLIDQHGRLRAMDVAVLGIQLCSALGYLHRQGWVHLDVKPSNVVEAGGRAVLLDLSLVCRVGDRSSGGTFDYLSPEQARGDEMTPAADVWGLGITLYEAFSGTTPWAEFSHREKRGDGTRRYPQTESPAAPLRTHRRMPAVLSRTVDACLDQDPASRPTVQEVSDVLQTWSGVDPANAE
ncbi:serine/threonine protein kinase [Saccharopolyspora erythraea NRRL 2338]|uniref:Serine/threonine protein kinase n=2 Tax=Saccharopolyspora erythraea TaxID=1836 RepID=A4FPE0_SACEN|nr:serine/threonine-protein kinase [Saccharopolyspora erythraea]EQD86706.1 protein kinase [Saccharopolyspora erythraea D]PFG99555.1 serine/threonine protein kinase [Saccharopolyspora erythraea NRRL 2338]QRK89454.1 serine/threonine protein kinase [Saccharopolyspora erythraea]CAM05915.1 serine/threonine protein kinase [Saccharopolyspora erythraea NRRL 2338]